jgi:hypothetical protein
MLHFKLLWVLTGRQAEAKAKKEAEEKEKKEVSLWVYGTLPESMPDEIE